MPDTRPFPVNEKALTEPYWNPSGKTVSKEALAVFAEKLYVLMVKKGWTQADLARNSFGKDEAGRVIDREKVSLWLRGQGLPGEAKMRRLAWALNVSLKDLAPQIEDTPLARTKRNETPRLFKLRKEVPLSHFASVKLQSGGKVLLQLDLPNELAQLVMDFAKRKVEQFEANGELQDIKSSVDQ